MQFNEIPFPVIDKIYYYSHKLLLSSYFQPCFLACHMRVQFTDEKWVIWTHSCNYKRCLICIWMQTFNHILLLMCLFTNCLLSAPCVIIILLLTACFPSLWAANGKVFWKCSVMTKTWLQQSQWIRLATHPSKLINGTGNGEGGSLHKHKTREEEKKDVKNLLVLLYLLHGIVVVSLIYWLK